MKTEPDRHVGHAEIDALCLSELTGRLRDLHTQRTPLGWPTAEAVTKSAVERRILELVTRRDPSPVDDPTQQVVCDVDVVVRSSGRASIRTGRATLQPGSLFVETAEDLPLGTPVEVEITADGSYRVRGSGVVGFRAHGKPGMPAGLGIGFTTIVGDAAERRLSRFVLELIRHRQ